MQKRVRRQSGENETFLEIRPEQLSHASPGRIGWGAIPDPGDLPLDERALGQLSGFVLEWQS